MHKPDISSALIAAVEAIYFDDNADFIRALYEVIYRLDPDLYHLVVKSPQEAYYKVKGDPI